MSSMAPAVKQHPTELYPHPFPSYSKNSANTPRKRTKNKARKRTTATTARAAQQNAPNTANYAPSLPAASAHRPKLAPTGIDQEASRTHASSLGTRERPGPQNPLPAASSQSQRPNEEYRLKSALSSIALVIEEELAASGRVSDMAFLKKATSLARDLNQGSGAGAY
ncbi:hypothetical protein OPT61_g6290 [Boeremia exigua]|uniref:Uncharacterized protein n=1 Tax=Boeremia exigua TaxID=749465 RepID=A0ACC2I7G8_9PLEO|nr:hypothetical protein OPT61_g6290 [Boeremia exigua]